MAFILKLFARCDAWAKRGPQVSDKCHVTSHSMSEHILGTLEHAIHSLAVFLPQLLENWNYFRLQLIIDKD